MTKPDGKKVVIAGGSGFVGISLANHLIEAGWTVTILSRNRPKPNGHWQFFPWDARTLGDWKSVVDGADGLINLAGRSVDCVKTPDHVDQILRSRVESTRVLGWAVRSAKSPPPVWVQMSTAHIYGDPPTEVCNEDSAFGYGLAPEVGKAWEQQLREGLLDRQRSVVLRTSFVLGRDRGAGSGALKRLGFLARMGLGGTIARGTQGISWIHELDLNRLFERALTDSSMRGAYIASAPNPVSNRDFMRELRYAVRMPIGLPAYEWMVRIGAPLLLATDPELALYGRYVKSKRLQDEEFHFRFVNVRDALADVL